MERRIALTSFALALVACAPGAPRSAAGGATVESGREPLSFGAPACTVEPVGRGCRVYPFVGPCAAFLSADEGERKQLQQSQYLNLRFAGDHRPFVHPPPVLPSAAHRSLVVPGGSVSALVILLELLGAKKSLYGPDFPTEDIVTYVAHSSEYTGAAYRLTPDALHRLATVDDVRTLSAKWDSAARASSPTIVYQPNAADDCKDLLSNLVELARDAEQTSRAVYVVGSLAKFTPQCDSLGGCDGYGCDETKPPQSDRAESVCHSERDECLSPLDCDGPQGCVYDADSARWTCRAVPLPLQ